MGKNKRVYGIAEIREKDGPITAKLVYTEAEDLNHEPVETKQRKIILHWYESREDAEKAFNEAMIMFYLKEKELGGYSAANTHDGEFEEAMRLLAAENDAHVSDIEARLVLKP